MTTNPLDSVAAALHRIHLEKPAAYVWEVFDGEKLILDKADVNPHFAHKLIPLYTRDQLDALLGEE